MARWLPLLHAVVGEYMEVRRPEQLAYTWTWEGEPEEFRGRRVLDRRSREKEEQTMSTDVQVEIRIGRPRMAVARYASDWRNDPTWIGAISEARLVTEPPFGVGSKVERVATFLGRRIEYVNEVVEYDPEARLVMRSVKAPFPMTVVYEFEDADGGTLMRIRAQGDASGFYRLAGPVLSRAVKRSIGSDLARLKAALEGEGHRETMPEGS